MDEVRFDLVAWLVLICAVLVSGAVATRAWIARNSRGRLAQLRFRRLHGAALVERMGGRLDPRPGSPWIDTWIDGRAVQLVAAPLDGRMQAGVLLLQHELPVNVWHVDGDDEDDDLEALQGVDLDELRAIVPQLRDAEVDSVTCGTSIHDDPRPPHLLRLRFDAVDDLPGRLARVTPLLLRLEALSPAGDQAGG